MAILSISEFSLPILPYNLDNFSLMNVIIIRLMATNDNPLRGLALDRPQAYCEYAGGPCDQTFGSPTRSRGVFLYPSNPSIIANTIEAAVQELGRVDRGNRWTSWKHFGIEGQIIFCEICKALRFTDLVIADVTTLNFNLLFEIGYALGLGLPVVPIRDTWRSLETLRKFRRPYPKVLSDYPNVRYRVRRG